MKTSAARAGSTWRQCLVASARATSIATPSPIMRRTSGTSSGWQPKSASMELMAAARSAALSISVPSRSKTMSEGDMCRTLASVRPRPAAAPRRDGLKIAALLHMSQRTHKDRTTLDYVRPGAEDRGRLRETFDFNDLNRDGRLTLGEFIRFMESVDENVTSPECEIGFDEIDTNRDGAIGFEEFYEWWTRG